MKPPFDWADRIGTGGVAATMLTYPMIRMFGLVGGVVAAIAGGIVVATAFVMLASTGERADGGPMMPRPPKR